MSCILASNNSGCSQCQLIRLFLRESAAHGKSKSQHTSCPFPRIPMRHQESPSALNSSFKYPKPPAFDFAHDIWLTAAEAAQYLQIKTRTILFWARSGRIKAYPLIGIKRRVWRFSQSDLDAVLIHSTPVISSAQLSVRSTERRAL